MVSDVITVLAPLKDGQEDACRAVLSALNTETGIRINFSHSNRTHFARFLILPDCECGKNRKRLLFSAVYDGDRETFLRDMRDNTSDLDALWSFCEDYRGKNDFMRFIKAHDIQTNLYLKAFRYDTVSDIQKFLALRAELARKFDVPPAQQAELLKQHPPSALIGVLRRGWRLLTTFLSYLLITISLIPQMIALLRFGLVLIPATRLMLSRVSLDREYSDAPVDKSGPCYPFAPGDEVVPVKELDSLPAFQRRQMVQNQVTLVTVNGPATRRRQEAVIASLGVFIKVPFLTRNRIIPTIHYARWLMIDETQRMLFLSDYDGSVLNYVSDFVDILPSGLDTLWNGTAGWRPSVTLDAEALNEGILCHNIPALFHYCAYPNTTVVGIEQARDLYYAYHENINHNWLKLV